MPEAIESPTLPARRQSLFCPVGAFHHRPRKGSRRLLSSPRLEQAVTCTLDLLRMFLLPAAGPGSCRPCFSLGMPRKCLGLSVCSCLAGMGLILSLAALAVLGCVLGACWEHRSSGSCCSHSSSAVSSIPPQQGWAGAWQGTGPGQPQTDRRDIPDQVTPAQV